MTRPSYHGDVALTAVKHRSREEHSPIERRHPVSDLTATIDTYLAAWNETDSARRAGLVEQVWASDGRLIDPPLAAEGHAGISDMAAALQAQFPGHRFRRASGIDEHHGYLRFGWELVGPDGGVALAGMDVAELTANGKLQRITGFFGPLPADGA
jgi:SnoaL-like domain